MLNEGTTDYPFTLSQKELNHDDPLVQKWVGMVDRCLEQQWKDSQQLLGCAKALKNSNNHSQWNLDRIVKELSYLELGIIQRFIDLRQELVNHAYPIEDNKAVDDSGVVNAAPKKNLRASSSFYMSLPSSPESDIYEPLLSRVNPLKTTAVYGDDNGDDNIEHRDAIMTGDSPFTLHSKLWQHHRLQQKRPDSLCSSSSSSSLVSSPKHMRPLLAPSSSAPVIHDVTQQEEDLPTECSPHFQPACTYNYYPKTKQQPAMDQQQCQQCFFCRSSMPRQKSFSLNEPARSVKSSGSSCSQDEDIGAHQFPSPPIPIRTSSSLDTAAATPFMINTSTPVLGTHHTLASHITPSTPSSSSSMVHTMFHFKRNTDASKKKSSSEAFSHHCTASATSEHGKSGRFVRSLMIHRKVSFPTLFSSNKKVHPMTTTNNDDDRSVGSSFLL